MSTPRRHEERDLERTVKLVLHGHVPSKKNQWRPIRGRIVLDKKARSYIVSLVTQARIAWGPAKAWVNPDMDVQFWVRSARSDRDNKLSCILDVLQEAGVILNDNTAQFNGTLVLKPAVITDGEEATRIVITGRAA